MRCGLAILKYIVNALFHLSLCTLWYSSAKIVNKTVDNAKVIKTFSVHLKSVTMRETRQVRK